MLPSRPQQFLGRQQGSGSSNVVRRFLVRSRSRRLLGGHPPSLLRPPPRGGVRIARGGNPGRKGRRAGPPCPNPERWVPRPSGLVMRDGRFNVGRSLLKEMRLPLRNGSSGRLGKERSPRRSSGMRRGRWALFLGMRFPGGPQGSGSCSVARPLPRSGVRVARGGNPGLRSRSSAARRALRAWLRSRPRPLPRAYLQRRSRGASLRCRFSRPCPYSRTFRLSPGKERER
jgi:hypothetical protein